MQNIFLPKAFILVYSFAGEVLQDIHKINPLFKS